MSWAVILQDYTDYQLELRSERELEIMEWCPTALRKLSDWIEQWNLMVPHGKARCRTYQTRNHRKISTVIEGQPRYKIILFLVFFDTNIWTSVVFHDGFMFLLQYFFHLLPFLYIMSKENPEMRWSLVPFHLQHPMFFFLELVNWTGGH